MEQPGLDGPGSLEPAAAEPALAVEPSSWRVAVVEAVGRSLLPPFHWPLEEVAEAGGR